MATDLHDMPSVEVYSGSGAAAAAQAKVVITSLPQRHVEPSFLMQHLAKFGRENIGPLLLTAILVVYYFVSPYLPHEVHAYLYSIGH